MPRKPKEDRFKQKNLIPVRVTDSENRLLVRAAQKARLPVATFARLAVINDALQTIDAS